ncbi:MAG TPA: LLM class flavin-dependent oxidoreductase [Actinophytocola sp.]|uniref:LLM class flavin-dependent oxidoreductase n=1 Tax=Actinophytocola sp. TaxID=1872138 RepID=UPI002DC03A5D|nr:LLM class flavin-dependent oxidoreductase [Actinophytocola sp.]HEU5473565.1 LLM class flavin-dependent oxidoreductase [Actinophytocola sp.]
MEISLALPNMIPGASGAALLDWARAAEERGFAGLAATERLVYPGYDPLVALAAAAGVTERIRLMTNVLIAPLRSDAELAKQTAGLDQLCGGRLVLGLAPGVRADDFAVAGRSFDDRVDRFNASLRALHELWAGKVPPGCDRAVGPSPVSDDRIPLLIGGITAAAARRVARWAQGWTAPGLSAAQTVRAAERVRAAWSSAGRTGAPRIVMLQRFALGSDAAEPAAAFVRDYFAVLGDAAEDFVTATPRSASAIRSVLAEYADCGVDEVVFHPTVADPVQVHRLADVTL